MNAARIIAPVLAVLLAFACGSRKTEVADDGVYYTCSMHPQVMEQQPGNCPICKMPLIAVRENTTQDQGELQLNELQIKLGNIRVDSARVRTLGEELLLPGRIVVDQQQLTTISTRVMGRVEELHFKNIGERVAQGQPLYTIYSEELSITVSELLFARDLARQTDPAIADPGRLEGIARNKLMAYGLTEAQVNTLATLESTPNTIEFLSPATGVITELPMREGETLMQGAVVMKIASLSSLWVEAQVYPLDRTRIKLGAECRITLPGLPDTVIKARLSFANPELASASIVDLIRLDIPNTGGILQPGMQVYVHVPIGEVTTLALPTDAVLRDGEGASVWIATGPGRFKVIMVSIGVESGGFTEVTEGIKAGDQVVLSGAYLLNSEFKFRQGTDPMAGMEM
ncbi:MAG: efflux RND transporter periplasmic adaptor subunit [Flavobacteriales bacterium]|nr:efflux RND transporter periplasmic adaptor subunit [Flavobacteriales bacterium]MBP6696036.1 efflux RND transporter periplasmic adaptor subunit [Flavobacteriales bacterium]